jgi:transcriptional regulator with XRE-family HTH domain
MAVDIRIQVGRRIRQLRRNRTWRQIDLCEKSGISASHLSDLENGRREICLLTIERLAKAFGIPPADLLR